MKNKHGIRVLKSKQTYPKGRSAQYMSMGEREKECDTYDVYHEGWKDVQRANDSTQLR